METNAPASTGLDSASAPGGFLPDLPPLETIPSPFPWLWLLVAIAVAALAYWLVQRYLKHRAARALAPEPELPAHERALLAMRDAMPLIEEPKRFVIAISDALRVYLEQRFALRAPEQTTEEFLSDLAKDQTLSGHHKSQLTEFMNQCDLVKFARQSPAKNELYQLYDSAVSVVQETRDTHIEEAHVSQEGGSEA